MPSPTCCKLDYIFGSEAWTAFICQCQKRQLHMQFQDALLAHVGVDSSQADLC